MKKLLAAFLLATVMIVSCKEKKTNTTDTGVVIGDSLPIIDTTVVEPGPAPIADNVAATRMDKKDKEEKQKKVKISCAWGDHKFNGNEKFNHKKRNLEQAKRAKPPRGGGNGHGHNGGGGDTVVVPPPPPPPPQTTSTNVAFLNFFGATISGTMWNVNGLFTVGDAGVTQPEADDIAAQVAQHFAPYNIRITMDRAVFDSAQYGHKIEVDITEDYQWYGQAGGVAYINSFFWTDHSPAFVFSTLLNYSVHNIEEAVAHEIGHTLGLRHQSDCTNGVNTLEYSYGKTMGNSYQTFPIGPWVFGTNSLCANQDDDAIITTSIGKRLIASYFLKPKNKL